MSARTDLFLNYVMQMARTYNEWITTVFSDWFCMVNVRLKGGHMVDIN